MKSKRSSNHHDDDDDTTTTTTTVAAENEATFKEDTDICQQLMDRYSTSSAPQHRHLIAIAAAMKSILESESLPLTPRYYFAAAIDTLDSQSLDSSAVSALLTLLAIVVPIVRKEDISAAKATEAVEMLVPVVEREELSVASVRCGVKCLGVLTIDFCDLDDWSSAELGFLTILKYSLDKRPKVRRCAQECLENVFKSLHFSKEASESIHSLLMKHMPEAIRITTLKKVSGPKDATLSKPEHQEILHLLNVIKLTIPHIDSDVASTISSELCKLLKSQFSPLTRHVIDSIEAMFKREEVIIPELENVTTSLASYLSSVDNSPSEIIIAAINLLKHALDKLHTGKSSVWLRNLPIVCDSIAGLLTSEASIRSQASGILNDLFEHQLVINEYLSTEDQIRDSKEMSVVVSTCVRLENILDSSTGIPNENILAVMSVLFAKLGALSFILMKNIVSQLSNMVTVVDKDNKASEHLESCIGSAVTAMGPEKMLALFPIAFNADDMTCSNIWLVPILKSYVVGASIGYYMDHIVPLAKSIQRSTRKVKKSVISKDLQALSCNLWGLLPAFCNYPTDTHKSLKKLAQLFMKHLKDSFMHEIIAAALKVLVHQNRSVLGSESDAVKSSAPEAHDSSLKFRRELLYSKKTATKNVKALKLRSAELLQALTDLFIASVPEKRSYLKDAIGCLGSITDSSVTKDIFMSLLERYQFVDSNGEFNNQDSSSSEVIDEKEDSLGALKRDGQRFILMELASSFVQGADEDLIHLIYNFIKHTFQGSSTFSHREAYYALSRILEEHNWFCSSQLGELIDLLLGLKATDNIPLLRSRYACLQILMVHALKTSLDDEDTKAFLLLNEIILALKNAKEEGRKVAYDALIVLSDSLRGSSSTIDDGPYQKLINMIMGYLSGSSPHITSGAVSALSVLAYKDPDLFLLKPDLISSLLALLHTKGLEIIKAVLGFVKVLVSSLEAKDLHQLLSDIVGTIIPWSSVSRNHFRAKVIVILEIVIRKCGTAAVEFVTPEKFRSFMKTVLENRRGKASSKEADTVDPETNAADSSSKGTPKRKRTDFGTKPEENNSNGKSNWSKRARDSNGNGESKWSKRPRNSERSNATNGEDEGSWKKRSFDKSPVVDGKRRFNPRGSNKNGKASIRKPSFASKFSKFKSNGKN
ncbi:hypothetical protein ACFE04_001896 [Oxalis oulophora]